MNNKIVIMAAVIIVAIFVGVGVTVQMVFSPELRRVIEENGEMLARMNNIETLLEANMSSGGTGLGSTDLKRVEMKLDALTKMVGGVSSGTQQRAARPQEDYTTVHEIEIGNSPIMGGKDAPITITSFVDMECPFSARFQPIIDAVVKAYPKQVKQILKNFPLGFHKHAKPAAKAALAAGEQGKYWEMLELILKNRTSLSDEKYQELAASLGLDVNKFSKDLKEKDAEWEELIKKDSVLAQKVGVRGTPTYYLNGRKTRSRTVEAFKAEIDKILKEEKE